jgi:hypothetical protein
MSAQLRPSTVLDSALVTAHKTLTRARATGRSGPALGASAHRARQEASPPCSRSSTISHQQGKALLGARGSGLGGLGARERAPSLGAQANQQLLPLSPEPTGTASEARKLIRSEECAETFAPCSTSIPGDRRGNPRISSVRAPAVGFHQTMRANEAAFDRRSTGGWCVRRLITAHRNIRA